MYQEVIALVAFCAFLPGLLLAFGVLILLVLSRQPDRTNDLAGHPLERQLWSQSHKEPAVDGGVEPLLVSLLVQLVAVLDQKPAAPPTASGAESGVEMLIKHLREDPQERIQLLRNLVQRDNTRN